MYEKKCFNFLESQLKTGYPLLSIASDFKKLSTSQHFS